MTSQEIYNQVLSQIDWIHTIAKRKKWTITHPPQIERPATLTELEAVENQIGKPLPGDLRQLFLFSKHAEFRYQFDEELSAEFSSNFSGEVHWNLDTLAGQYHNFLKWVDTAADPAYNDPESIAIIQQLWQDKFPLIDVPNGDIIAVGSNPSEVIYFSHEGDVLHGKILGDTLWSFLEFHSRIGFAGSEDWQIQPFFDFNKNCMLTAGDKVERFIRLLGN